MSRTRYKIYDNSYPHFITCTVVEWLPVFTRKGSAQILLDSWTFLQTEGRIKLFAYVILENHVHFIAAGDELGKEIGDFKSYTVRRLIDLLTAAKATTILDQLAFRKKRHKDDREYQFWQEGSATADFERSDDVAENRIHSQQSSQSRLRGRSCSLAVFEHSELRSDERVDRGEHGLVVVRSEHDAERRSSAFPRRAWERGLPKKVLHKPPQQRIRFWRISEAGNEFIK
jgi:REP element-mobilizing transposase RayT